MSPSPASSMCRSSSPAGGPLTLPPRASHSRGLCAAAPLAPSAAAAPPPPAQAQEPAAPPPPRQGGGETSDDSSKWRRERKKKKKEKKEKKEKKRAEGDSQGDKHGMSRGEGVKAKGDGEIVVEERGDDEGDVVAMDPPPPTQVHLPLPQWLVNALGPTTSTARMGAGVPWFAHALN